MVVLLIKTLSIQIMIRIRIFKKFYLYLLSKHCDCPNLSLCRGELHICFGWHVYAVVLSAEVLSVSIDKAEISPDSRNSLKMDG